MSSMQQPLGTYDTSLNMAAYRQVGENQACLDVGCWTGNMGRELIRHKRCMVDGIDFHPAALQEAKKNGYRKLFQLDLNDSRATFVKVDDRYNIILCCDVLEHLLQPQDRLCELRSLLKPDGRIIVSLPNIGFILYRLKHLFGMWNYEDKGVMDRTHIIFFTKNSAEKMFRSAGYSIETFTAYNAVSSRYSFLKSLGRLWPSLFAIQLVYVLSPQKIKDEPS